MSEVTPAPDSAAGSGTDSADSRTGRPVDRLARRAWIAVLAAGLVLGALQGALWALVTPGIPYKVLADGRFGALPTTSTYSFLGLALFALSGVAIGAGLAVAAWQLRSRRGPQMLLTLVLSCLLGAAVAVLVAGALAQGVDPATVGVTAADSIVLAAPTLVSLNGIVAQPTAAAAVYTILVAWNGTPELGRVEGSDP